MISHEKLLLSQANSAQQQIKGYANRKEIVKWLLQTPQEIRFKLTPSFNRFHRPDDFVFTAANQATAMMMGRSSERLIGQKLIEVLDIHPFHQFFQNYLRTYLYQSSLQQNIDMPMLSRKQKRIVHEAKVVDGELVVVIKVVPKETPSALTVDTAPKENLEQQLAQIATQTEDLEVADQVLPVTPEKETSSTLAEPEVEALAAVSHQNVITEPNKVAALSEPETNNIESIALETAASMEPPVEESIVIDPLASQQVSVDGKIEFVNEAICDTLELSEYKRQEIFMQDILHKVSQLPYHLALLQAKTQKVVKNLPLIFVTKSKKYVKVKGRIEPQTRDGQVTGLRFYYQVLKHTPDFHQVAAFGKVPAFNSF